MSGWVTIRTDEVSEVNTSSYSNFKSVYEKYMMFDKETLAKLLALHEIEWVHVAVSDKDFEKKDSVKLCVEGTKPKTIDGNDGIELSCNCKCKNILNESRVFNRHED